MTFDPYDAWLRIPRDERPPTFYRLVGVTDFEADLEKIHQCALKGITEVRRHQTGKHSDMSQSLLNEISQALTCLTDPVRKKEYDRRLRLERSSAVASNGRYGLLRGRGSVAVALVLIVTLSLVSGVLSLNSRESTSPGGALTSANKKDQPTATIPGPATAVPRRDNSYSEVAPIGGLATGAEEASSRADAGSASSIDGHSSKAPSSSGSPGRDAAESPTAASKSLRVFDSAEPLALRPGEPVNLGFINSPKDENHPFLEANGLVLHFSRDLGDRTRLRFARRTDPALRFSTEEMLLGLPETGNMPSIALAPDGTSVVYSSDHEGALHLYRALRQSPGGRIGPGERILATDDTLEADPFFAPGGKELYFTRIGDGVRRAYVAGGADRGDFTGPFSATFDDRYHGASVTADGLAIYLQAPAQQQQQRWAIYRARRQSESEPWGRPVIVPGLTDDVATVGAVSPCVTPDGKMLLYASDRAGGVGGLDLWIVELADDQTPVIEPTVAEPTVAEPADPAEPNQSLDGPIDRWLVLGPFPRASFGAEGSIKRIRNLQSRLRRRLPKAGEKTDDREWRLADGVDRKRGVYVIVFPFTLDRPQKLRLSVDDAPGGGFFWIDNRQVLALQPDRLWRSAEDVATNARPYRRLRGSHRVVGVICVADRSVPLTVRLLDDETGAPAKGIQPEF